MYVPAEVESGGDQRIVEAAATFRAGVVTGWAALRWLGARWFNEGAERPVPLVLQADEGTSRQPGLVTVSQEFLHPDEVHRIDGLRLTTPVRSTAFEMRYAGTPLRAAQIFAMAAYDDFISCEELARYCEEHLPRCTGVGLVREVLPGLTENAWSPTEVTMGWVWQDLRPGARLVYNCPAFTLDGRHLGTPDILDLESGVIGEYQGSLHLAGERRAADVVRDDRLRAAGLEMAIMLAVDLRNPSAFVARLEGAYGRARRRTQSWTVEPPSWWTSTSTVTSRRSLEGERRQKLLRYREAS